MTVCHSAGPGFRWGRCCVRAPQRPGFCTAPSRLRIPSKAARPAPRHVTMADGRVLAHGRVPARGRASGRAGAGDEHVAGRVYAHARYARALLPSAAGSKSSPAAARRDACATRPRPCWTITPRVARHFYCTPTRAFLRRVYYPVWKTGCAISNYFLVAPVRHVGRSAQPRALGSTQRQRV
ncbi:hypothetical protein AURDEDRAFT_184339, partial [Auricularia subglabra TFB-10046 SS5]